jgi:predicted secreted hydrolase
MPGRTPAAQVLGLAALVLCIRPWARADASPPASLGVLPGTAQEAAGFQQAVPGRAFVFPRDHGPHPEFRHEWWYLTGNLDAANGERFGFELTFFRFAVAPQGAPPASPAPSAWRAREIYMAHFAVSDVARRRFRFAQKISRAALGLAGAGAEPLHVWLDDWSLTRAAPQAAAEPAAGGWQLHAAQTGYEIDLTLAPQMGPVLNGDAGLSRKSDNPADASY